MASVHPDPLQALEAGDAGRFLDVVADSIPQLVWATTPDGGADYFNSRLLAYTGLSAEQLAGQRWREIIHADDRERVAVAWNKASRAGERYMIECRLRRADGAYRWHHISALPLRGRDGSVLRWFGTCTEIEADERLRALHQAQARLRALIENEPECVKLLDAEGRLLEMNAAGLRMIEVDSAEAVLGKCVYGIVAPEHVGAFRALNERVCRGERGTLEFEMVGLKGTRRWLETHAVPFRDEASGEVRLLSITRDVTDRKHAEQALRESERRFQAFMEHAPAAAWIKDGRFRYAYVNRTYELVYGRPASEVLGRDDFELHAPDLARFYREEDEKIVHSSEAAQRTHAISYADGRPGHWLVVKFPLRDAAGETGVAGMAIDVTSRLEAEEKARRYAEEVRTLVGRLVQAQEAERRRVADELHDLIGQNLTALGIDLQALKQRLQSAGDQIAAPRLDAMAALVETTIDAIRGVMTDLRPVALEDFGLVPALRWYASQFSKRTGIKVATRAPRRELRLPPDTELALFRIVQEALTNAAKHSGGTSVEIRIRYGEQVELTVQDDGCGFSEAAAGARAARGDGFGLATMRERAEAHGGRLRVEFPGRGTRIVVELPRQVEIPVNGRVD